MDKQTIEVLHVYFDKPGRLIDSNREGMIREKEEAEKTSRLTVAKAEN